MNKSTMNLVLAAALGFSAAGAQAVLPNGTLLTLTPGVYSYDAYGNPSNVSTGSWFAMDTNGNSKITGAEKLPLSPGQDGGLIIGAAQDTNGHVSHPGSPHANAGGIDAEWSFFGNAGMDYTTKPVVSLTDTTLDLSGWTVTWNGIPAIDMGGLAWGTGFSNGVANLAWDGVPGHTYVLEYAAAVPLGDPSGFGGVKYFLHLEGVVSDITSFTQILINIAGGAQQECTATGGTLVTLDAAVTVPAGDEVASINWSVDGTPVGSGASIVSLVPVGTHSLMAELQTIGGSSATSVSQMTVFDTQSPVVNAAFVNSRTGKPVTSIQRNAQLGIEASATDVCDPSPVIQATVGAPVTDGGVVAVSVAKDLVSISVPEMSLSVTATDASSNAASGGATLTIAQ